MNSSRLLRIGLLAVTLSASACATTYSCPPVVVYDKAFREDLADAIVKLPEESPIVIALTDYYILRKQVRVCSK